MSIKLRNLEWLNHNSQRAYPLAQDATQTDATGTFELPTTFIVGIVLPVHWASDITPGNFYIKSISNFASGFSVTVGYSGASEVDVASALIARSSHTENQVYGLGGLGDFADSRGHIVIGDLANMDNQPAGQFNFDLAGGRLEPDVIRPQVRGVHSIQLQNGAELSEELYGRVRLRAGRNIQLSTDLSGDDPIVIIDAIQGAGLTDDCLCEDDAPCITTINGIPPDGSGNFQFFGNDCVDVAEGEHSITFNDICSEPCCGCKELEVITSALEAFGDKATTLENFLVNLEARVTEMDMVVLGSRLGDRGCDPECI